MPTDNQRGFFHSPIEPNLHPLPSTFRGARSSAHESRPSRCSTQRLSSKAWKSKKEKWHQGVFWCSSTNLHQGALGWPFADFLQKSSWIFDTLPKTNSSPLKIGHPKRKLVFQPSIFRCHPWGSQVGAISILIDKLSDLIDLQAAFAKVIKIWLLNRNPFPTTKFRHPRVVPDFLRLARLPTVQSQQITCEDTVLKERPLMGPNG